MFSNHNRPNGQELNITIAKLTFRNGSISVGDVFVSSWGYEQTNVNFYQVVSLHGTKTVTVREITAKSRAVQSMAGYTKPLINNFVGDPIRRQIKETGSKPSIKIADFEYARLTAPEEEHFYSSWY